jgi:hypothetical protein
MTIKQLLGGAAAAALLSGVSYAAPTVVVGGGDFNGQTLAIETLDASNVFDGDLVLDIDVSGEFVSAGAGAIIDMVVILTNATWDGPVPDFSLNNGTAAAACQFSTNPDLDGGNGQSSVTFFSSGQVNLCGAAADGDLTLTLPISVTDTTQAIGVEVQFNPRVNPGGYAGASVSVDSDDLLQYDNALEFTLTAGIDADNELTASGDAFLPGGTGILGSLSLAYDDGLNFNLTQTLSGQGMDAGDIIESASLSVVFSSLVGIDGLELNGVACSVAGTTFTCDLDDTDITALAGNSIDIVFDVDGDGGVVQQTPSASLSVVADDDANDAADVFAGLSSTDLAEITLDDGLDLTSLGAANFAWVRFGTGGTESNFRIQFADEDEAASVTEVRVQVAAGNGVDAQTVVLEAGTANDGFVLQGATITFNSRALGAVSGETGNADITGVQLQHSDDEDPSAATILRQLVNRNTANFVATPGLTSDN